jgi:hypothetical protein
MKERQDDSARAEHEGRERRPYRRPELKEYGPVAKLTSTGAGSRLESGISNRKSCL